MGVFLLVSIVRCKFVTVACVGLPSVDVAVTAESGLLNLCAVLEFETLWRSSAFSAIAASVPVENSATKHLQNKPQNNHTDNGCYDDRTKQISQHVTDYAPNKYIDSSEYPFLEGVIR